jgi:hypothetical protein
MRRALVSAALALAGCSALPVPRPGSVPPEGAPDHLAPVPVPSPPDPGKVEITTPRPKDLKNPVWVDGQWMWTGRRWQWKEGGWEEQPPDRYYTAPWYVRLDDGAMFYVPGRWTSTPQGK